MISYDLDARSSRKQWSRPLIALGVINAAFAGSMISAWTYAQMFVAEPLAWATWMRVYRGGAISDIFNYPFVLLWLMPACGLAIAYVAGEGRRWSMAWAALLLPVIILGVTIGWYYIAPPDWH
jgi:hypothetical protein